MSTQTQPAGSEHGRPNYWRWLRGALIILPLLVVARLVLEIAAVPHTTTRYLSSSVALFLVAVYLGAIAPLRGVRRLAQLILPAIVVAAWTAVWVILATLVSGAFRLELSHFAEQADWGDWTHLRYHVFEHIIEIPILALLVLVLMYVMFFLRHWPITVGPAAVLGGLVVMRFWAEAMGAPRASAGAWSSTVGVLICAFYLGGDGSRFGLTSPWRLFVPSIVIGWVWRFWIFSAAVMSAAAPYYRTHFFDPSEGRVAVRLIRMLGESVVGGFVAGLLVWGIAAWVFRATRPGTEAR